MILSVLRFNLMLLKQTKQKQEAFLCVIHYRWTILNLMEQVTIQREIKQQVYAVFNLERYLIADDSLSMTATITDAGSAQDNLIFGYKLGTTGGYNTFTESQTINISDNNKISVVLNNTDGGGAKLTADNYSIKLTFEFEGKDDSYAPNFDKYKVDVVVNAQVKEREVSIVSLTDDDALGIDLQINRTNVTRWRYKLYIDPDGANTLLHEDNTSTFRTGDNLKIPITPTELFTMYKVVVYGVSDVNSDVVTEVSQNIQMGWTPLQVGNF